jgi:hypothetical protein
VHAGFQAAVGSNALLACCFFNAIGPFGVRIFARL